MTKITAEQVRPFAQNLTLKKQRRSIYMSGWDARLMGATRCPYRRQDFVRAWLQGWRDCDQGKPIASWVQP